MAGSSGSAGPRLVPPRHVVAAFAGPRVVPPRHVPVLDPQPQPSFRTPQKISADTEKATVQVAVVGAVKALQRSSTVASEHWYMWCCKYGKPSPKGTPQLDPTIYEVQMLSGFMTYWCDQISKPVSVPAADVFTSLADVTTETDVPAGDGTSFAAIATETDVAAGDVAATDVSATDVLAVSGRRL